ncbi:YbjN domain-containing protein [Nostoc sp. DedQUE07]|uniref:YbjN domain-containing protein n=1 Tax=Nostoc sp. DedQUE07 TaxID=3075392 RepID=UPI00391897B6
MIEKADQVEKWLRTLSFEGWKFSGALTGVSNSWLLERNEDKIYVHLNSNWLCFTLPLSNHPANSTFYKKCLELCRRSFMCKFSLSPDGKLLLQLEIPFQSIEKKQCYKAVDALNVYLKWYEALKSGNSSIHSQSANQIQIKIVRKQEYFPKESLYLYFNAIEHLNWGLKDNLGDNRWKAIYKGNDRPFMTYLYFNQYWLYFQIPILGQTPDLKLQNDEDNMSLYSYLLKLNEHIYWTKFGIDENGKIFMLLDIPLEKLDLNLFQHATKTIAEYANKFAYDLQIMGNLSQEKELFDLIPN